MLQHSMVSEKPPIHHSIPSQLDRRIQAAEGFLELGLPQLAEAELEKLEGDDRTSEATWVMRCRVYRASEQWEIMGEVAKHLVSLDPDVVEYWLDAAFATRKAGGVGLAHQVMTHAALRLPEEAQIRYHAACCAAQIGLFEQAKEHLQAAVAKVYDLKHAALQDPDMEPLWASMGI
jgi:Tfp pilus assembly protein PilF